MEMRQAFNLVKQMGPRWAAYQSAYALQQRTGWLERRLPLAEWSAYRLTELAPNHSAEHLREVLRDAAEHLFFVHPGQRKDYRARLWQLTAESDHREIVSEVEAVRRGEFRFFSHQWCAVGWPPAWQIHPETHEEWPATHWSQLSDLGRSDVKWLWELGRFGIVYAIVRAYWRTGEPQHAETFWQLIESFREANPPNCGVHWMCGQECSFRVLAWCFALFGLLDAPATTPQRVARLIEMLVAHGERIEGNIGFAISQKNNHAINEALALWTLGICFPMLRAASRFEARGRAILERASRQQIYNDGAYIQHSLNYHRLILQSYAWAIRLGEVCGRPLSTHVQDRYRRAAQFLYQLTDNDSGRAPNYGSNDGAILFRLDSCAFEDQRPTLALATWLSEKRRLYAASAQDETLLWLCGEEPFAAKVDPPARKDLSASEGGYFTLRAEKTWGMIRCAEYRDRPAQADMLHVDLWWRGANLLADPGTYSYNSPAPWKNGLSGTGAHNTVQVDGRDQMTRGPRFTWFHWNRGRVIRRGADETGDIKLFEGEQNGYERDLGVVHRRALMLVDGRLWIVVDDLLGAGSHRLSSRWLFPHAQILSRSGQSFSLRSVVGDFTVSFFNFPLGGQQAGMTLEVEEGAGGSTAGWFSSSYFKKEPAPGISAASQCQLPARIVTLISLDGGTINESLGATTFTAQLGTRQFETHWQAFPYPREDSLVRSMAFI